MHAQQKQESRLQELLLCVCVLLTQTVGQEVRGEALGTMAHRRIVVCVSSKHEHRPAHYNRRVEVTEEAAVSQNGPAQTHSNGCHTVSIQLVYSCCFPDKQCS